MRAYVGDNNKAIADLDIVLNFESYNYPARYNCSILKDYKGGYKEALMNIENLLSLHPNFVDGYYLRSDLKKKNKGC